MLDGGQSNEVKTNGEMYMEIREFKGVGIVSKKGCFQLYNKAKKFPLSSLPCPKVWI